MVTLAESTLSGPEQRRSGNTSLLESLGARVRALRKQHHITRKMLSASTGISERHLANLESGEGNVSIRVLEQVAVALHSSLAELTGDFTTRSAEWMKLRALLEPQDEASLRRIRLAVEDLLDGHSEPRSNSRRIALIGLRGAGKSTLGARLATRLDCPFIELSREVARIAGCGIGEIQALYGIEAYRRYQRRALGEAIESHSAAVIATPGGLVSDAEAFNRLLSSCSTVWLTAKPEDHMQRVIEQGDFRPMQGNAEAMHDLKAILEARHGSYVRAQHRLDTSAQNLEQTFAMLGELADEIMSAADPAPPTNQTHAEETTP